MFNTNYIRNSYVDEIKTALIEAGKSIDEVSDILNKINPNKNNNIVEKKASIKEKNNKSVVIPNIKILNDISDKMARGIAKKAFMAAKREKLDGNGYVEKIEEALIDADKSSDQNSKIIKKLVENE